MTNRQTQPTNGHKRPRPAAMGPDGQPLQAREGSHGRSLILLLAVVFGIGGWVLFNAAKSATQNPTELKLGSDVLQLSRNVKQFEERVLRDGPRLYPAPADYDTDVWVNQVDKNWYAFAARQPTEGRECNATWDQLGQAFVSSCDATKKYGPGGYGLPQYLVVIDEKAGTLVVDLAKPPEGSS
jgi:hypothetical protein